MIESAKRRWQRYEGGRQCLGCNTLIQYGWTVPNGPICGKCRFGDPDDVPDDDLVAVAQRITVERFSR